MKAEGDFRMEEQQQPTPQVLAAGLKLDDEGTCPVCGGTGGWPGISAWVECKPCGGTGLSNSV